MNLLGNSHFERLQSGLDAANLRNQVLANNIGNVDTPNYKRSHVAFENLLQREMDGMATTLSGNRTDTRHFQIGPSSRIPDAMVRTDHTTAMNNNGNNVDIDREMSLLAENQLRYNSYIQAVNHHIRMMRTAIEGR